MEGPGRGGCSNGVPLRHQMRRPVLLRIVKLPPCRSRSAMLGANRTLAPSHATSVMSLSRTVAILLLGVGCSSEPALVPAPPEPTPSTPEVALPDVAALDLERIHAELFPAWLLAHADRSARSTRARDALETLRKRTRPDPILDEALCEMDRLVRAGAWDHARELLDQAAAWNARVEALGEPYLLDAGVVSTPRREFFYAKSYRILSDSSAKVDDRVQRVRVLQRLDRLAVRESYLGVLESDLGGAVVVAGRVADAAIREVWPMLDGQGSETRQRRFATGIRAEIETNLGPQVMAPLAATAEIRRSATQAVDAIAARGACGSRYRIVRLPWAGISEEGAQRMAAAVERSTGSPCPEVTPNEADLLREGSARLRGTEGLEIALGTLAGLLSREVAVHELRHASDRAACQNETDWEPNCDGCGELSMGARRELSAYLASLAHGPTPMTSFFLACQLLDAEGGGHHQDAVAFLDEQLGGACAAPLPELQQRALSLEQRLFGGGRAVTLDGGYPAFLPLP